MNKNNTIITCNFYGVRYNLLKRLTSAAKSIKKQNKALSIPGFFEYANVMQNQKDVKTGSFTHKNFEIIQKLRGFVTVQSRLS